MPVAGQLAGFVEHFDGFTFATVRGAGHMVRFLIAFGLHAKANQGRSAVYGVTESRQQFCS